MEVTIQAQRVYGNDLLYPVNQTAHDFCRLLGCKTLSGWQLRIIESMGYTIAAEYPGGHKIPVNAEAL